MTDKIFYKKSLLPDKCGLVIHTEKWVSIHETEKLHFCVPEFNLSTVNVLKKKDETVLQCAKRLGRIKRIHKECSRIAFATEKEAMENLRYLKRKQLNHLNRQIAFNNAFLKAGDFDGNLVPDTADLVGEYFIFD